MEASLILMILMVTLIGIVDVGQVLVMHQGLAERVRAGARWAVVHPYDSDRIKNVVLYNNSEAAEGAQPLLHLRREMINTALVDSGTPEARVVVSVDTYQFRFFTPLIAGTYTARPIKISMPVEDPY